MHRQTVLRPLVEQQSSARSPLAHLGRSLHLDCQTHPPSSIPRASDSVRQASDSEMSDDPDTAGAGTTRLEHSCRLLPTLSASEVFNFGAHILSLLLTWLWHISRHRLSHTHTHRPPPSVQPGDDSARVTQLVRADPGQDLPSPGASEERPWVPPGTRAPLRRGDAIYLLVPGSLV